MDEKVNVLVLMPSLRTKFAICQLPEDVSKNYKFIFHSLELSLRLQSCKPSLDLLDYLDDARKIVLEEGIQLIITNNDMGALVKAVLVKESTHLRGPSIESVFLCYNKYYTRFHLDPQHIPFACIDLSATSLDHECEMALQKVGIPAFVKPSTLSGSQGLSTIMSLQQLKKFIPSYINSDVFAIEDVDASFMNPFYEKYIEKQKYPLATKPTSIVEQYLKDGTTIQVCADGYIFDGKIFHWSISDSLFSKSKKYSQYYLGVLFPTSLPNSTQESIWKFFDVVVGKMIDFGFNNEFVNMDIIVLESGEVKLVEINPRKGGNVLASAKVFIEENATAAQLKLAQGQKPQIPVWNGHYSMYSYIRTCGAGKAKEFYDYSFTDPDLIPEYPPDKLVDGTGQSGTILCRICLSGDSREEVLEKYWSTCRNVLLQPELSLWN